MTGPFGTTAGPWRVVDDMRSERVGDSYSDDGYRDYLAGHNVESDDDEIIGIEGIIPGGDAKNNARAIAQVPAMLELVRMANELHQYTNIVKAARAIVAELEKE